ncbi:ABC transporter ATP-binding protein [Terriglobus albidus]|uniref:ABC transporter ATP-binding protein n=1 Tax=Terriglobus albidus TaxID=1592106 RepID=A0A5B9EAB0_9BACT|nr:ABC transporter ATP-binding protein [Terriglobus albidus]QEE28709.1 ABC transporter ATP-binding protein [Terriglobus albidus]
MQAAVLTNVTKLYGRFAALKNLSVTLEAGAVYLVLGENGAGKSTLLRMLAGLSLPTRGGLTVLDGPANKQQRRVAYMSHATMLYDELTAMENLTYYSGLRKGSGECACSGSPEMALRAVGLDPHLNKPVSQYSQGMRQRVSLARVLSADPEMLLLDEPFSNLDVHSVAQMLDLLKDFRTWPLANGHARTIVLTTHQAELAMPLADHVLRIQAGEFVSMEATQKQ